MNKSDRFTDSPVKIYHGWLLFMDGRHIWQDCFLLLLNDQMQQSLLLLSECINQSPLYHDWSQEYYEDLLLGITAAAGSNKILVMNES
mmetsp:Transcript_11905/g.22297  ORF Transcript_11905/g.22297 Transcript_11905/m.22297 type:complete len:88 (+) Transcript_11905:1752-2015(+)